MNYYLGVDGGGTKTKFLLADGGGHICAEWTGPTCHYLQCGFDGLTEVLREGLHQCVRAAGIDCSALQHVFAACAGFGDVPNDTPRILAAAQAATDRVGLTVGNDCENAWAGALGGRPGINIIAGTGSIAYGRDESGAGCRCGGWHHLLGGDEGGGFWLAQQLLHEFTRQSDGRAPKTQLHTLVRETLSLQSDYDVITVVVERWNLDRAKVASLSRLVSQLAQNGDLWAVGLFRQAAMDLAELVLAVRDQLQFTGSVHCSYTGGVFSAGAALLGPLTRCLAQEEITLLPPRLEPDAGSVILAMLASGTAVAEAVLQNLANRTPAR